MRSEPAPKRGADESEIDPSPATFGAKAARDRELQKLVLRRLTFGKTAGEMSCCGYYEVWDNKKSPPHENSPLVVVLFSSSRTKTEKGLHYMKKHHEKEYRRADSRQKLLLRSEMKGIKRQCHCGRPWFGAFVSVRRVD